MTTKRRRDVWQRWVPSVAAVAIIAACGGGDELERSILTPDTDRYWNPQYSPDGTRLAYGRGPGVAEAIWTANADGSEATQLTATAEDVAHITWSPDGEWIAYTRYGPPTIVKVPTAGGDEVQLTDLLSLQVRPQWSPDGSRIMYLEGLPFQADLMMMSADGSHKRTHRATRNVTAAYWSPDGSRLALWWVDKGRDVLAVEDLDDGEVHELVGEGREELRAWSPDGSEIAYTSRRTGLPDIWTVPAEGGEPRRITRDIMADWNPRYSPDGQWIAFQSERGGQDDIWIVPAAGGEPLRVTNTPAEETGLVWTPDGQAVTFVHSELAWLLWKLDVTTGETRQLTFGTRDHFDHRISPDGRWVVYVDEGAGNDDIWVLSIDGGEPRQLTNRPVDDDYPKWSPDGTTIAYMSDADGRPDIFTVPFEGGEPTNVTSHPAWDWDAEWSPDGTRIAFLSDRDAPQDVYVIPADGGTATRLTHTGMAYAPIWSPDGRSLLYYEIEEGRRIAVYVIDADGGTPPRRLTQEGHFWNARWSPDGTRITYQGAGALGIPGGSIDIYVMDADGGNVQQLTTHRASDAVPLWSPDGTQILFATQRGGEADLAVVPADGGPVRMLTETPTINELRGWWTPDGATIVYLAGDRSNEIVSVNVGPLLRGERE